MGANLRQNVLSLVATLIFVALVFVLYSSGWWPFVWFGFDFAIGLVTLWALPTSRKVGAANAEPTALSILIAARNEESGIVDTLRSLALEREAREILIVDDGSTDRSAELCIGSENLERVTESHWPAWGAYRQYVREVWARAGAERGTTLVRITPSGKGTALEIARRAARHSILVTVDADTFVEPGALARLSAHFADQHVVAAAGSVRLQPNISSGWSRWLHRMQEHEYRRFNAARAAWANLGMLEQLPGAFTAVRADALADAGGYPEHNLTEDYEVAYRLFTKRKQNNARVAFAHDAVVRTAPPLSVSAFLGQRTRWFAGFLYTLFKYRAAIFDPRYGRFGTLRLPLKALDAVAALFALIGFLEGVVLHRSFVFRWEALLALIVIRVLLDVIFNVQALQFQEGKSARPSALSLFDFLVDGFSLGLLRQFSVFLAWGRWLSPHRSWQPTRAELPRPTSVLPATSVECDP